MFKYSIKNSVLEEKILGKEFLNLTSETQISGLELLQKADLMNDQILALKVNGEVWDLSRLLPSEATVEVVTAGSTAGLEVLRHSAAHSLAQAVLELYPEVQVTIGPVIENGFYYDFLAPFSFNPQNLEQIENKMQEIIARDLPIERMEWSREKAIAYFNKIGQPFKAKIIEDLNPQGILSVYHQGDFMDLCRGPHVPSTGKVGQGFKLTKVSGSYWRGDAKGQPLQRIYGLAFDTAQALEEYLHYVQEAERRDHRKVGQAMELFHFQPIAPGSVFWHPEGWTLYRLLQEYVRQKVSGAGYQEVNTPQLVSHELWQSSGHASKYGDNMFSFEQAGRHLSLKPMNCPCHVQIFNQGLKSYKDLPLRLAEFGSCMRKEASGALSGLMRVYSFTQDDGHIFCRPQQIFDEMQAFCRLLYEMYQDFGLQDVTVYLATRPKERFGSDEVWDQAEQALAQGMQAMGIDYELCPGDGAFYGPKIEFRFTDCLKRSWTLGTLQVDFVLPTRLEATYVDEQGQTQHPVMLHRAILGSFERFMGILLEHYDGRLPFWLAPTQGVVTSISEKTQAYGKSLVDLLVSKGFRIKGDFRNEKLGYKIREHTLRKVPCILVVGEKEQEQNQVMLRCGSAQKALTFPELEQILSQAQEKKIVLTI